MNDKIIIVPAVLALALLAYLNPIKPLIDFYMILASGFFGLVAGVSIGSGKMKAKDKENETISAKSVN